MTAAGERLSPSVRAERVEDVEQIALVEEAAFERPAEARLVERLRAEAHPTVSLVATLGDRLVGHVFVSPIEIEGPQSAPACGGLAPIGVLPEFQQKGIGSALMRRALEDSAALGWKAIFLLGDPAYYSRFGFALSAPIGIRYEHEIFDNHFQFLEIEAGALEGCSGWVRYHAAFADL